MTILEKIKERILKFLGLEHLSENPNDPRYTFINSEETIIRQKANENKIWYIGDSDELLNFYTNRDISGNAQEPIYNRNKPQYFWGVVVKEYPVKKVHSGVPKAIIDTISSIVGMPQIYAAEQYDERLQKILKENNFNFKLTQEARPMTLAVGWGAWKVNIAKSNSVPIIEYYEGQDVDFAYNNGILVGIVYRDYYKYKGKDYVLFETRRIKDNDSIIEYELFRLSKSNDITKVDLHSIPELESLPEQGLTIPNLKKVLGVPVKYFFDPQHKNYGKSIYAGKVDIFDDIDECLTQASQTDRVSTPVEYYPTSLLGRDKNGGVLLPKVYNRQYVAIETLPNGDGEHKGQIQTTQPNLNFGQYIDRYTHLLDVALTGILSPSSLGFNVAKKDNAAAQREKEKQTLFTVNSIENNEGLEITELCNILLNLDAYMHSPDGNFEIIEDGGVSVKYDEFGSPSFESQASILTPMFTQNAISTEMYVNMLYGDSLSEEAKQQEINALNELKDSGELNLGDFGLDAKE